MSQIFITLFSFFSNKCVGIGKLEGIEGTEAYCGRKCLRYPSVCPKDECRCFRVEDEKKEEEDNENVADIVES